LLTVLVLVVTVYCRLSDKIITLPGLTFQPNFNQYGGYIEVDPSHGKEYFYWFVESQNNPKTDPVVLWLQGGPGCSSLFGFLTEHGPFVIGTDAYSVYRNPFSWNTVANMLYLESLVGVGFSYSQTKSDYTMGDNITMQDNYNFLKGWFAAFPDFTPSTHAFYITGESYGGHYVPQLAYTILNNKNDLNLQGFAVGNPWTDDVIDSNSVPPFIWSHGLCSYATWVQVQQSCGITADKGKIQPTPKFIENMKKRQSLREKYYSPDMSCNQALNNMYNEVGNDINQYDIYWPCLQGAGLDCSNYTKETMYLNRKDVQLAIHAATDLPWQWSVCTDNINYDYSWNSVVPIYPLLTQNFRTTIYSGDVTFNVPFIGSEIWVESLGQKVVSNFTAWEVNGQVAGYLKKYERINFVTVKNAGHMVPTYQPQNALVFFEGYLKKIF